MIKPLIWKEWQEQRWKLAFGTVMLVFFTCSLIAARLGSDREIVVAVWICGGLILSLYSAMGVFAPEVTNRTTAFLSSRPIEPWKIFLCKWFFGWLNFAVPIFVCGLVLAAMVLTRPEWRLFELEYIVRSTVAGLCLGTMFYSMTCCLSPRKSSEAFVGFTGLIILTGMSIHAMLMISIFLRGLQYHKAYGILEGIILFINPFFWIDQINHKQGLPHESILFLEQAGLFVLCLWIGMRKLKRSL